MTPGTITIERSDAAEVGGVDTVFAEAVQAASAQAKFIPLPAPSHPPAHVCAVVRNNVMHLMDLAAITLLSAKARHVFQNVHPPQRSFNFAFYGVTFGTRATMLRCAYSDEEAPR